MEYWKKNLLIVWFCQFLTMVGMSAIVPFLPLFVRELGVTEFQETANWSGLVFAGPFFISFFLAPVWGNLGDKYGRKLMTIRAIFGLALAQILIGLSQNITHLFLGRLLQGMLSGFLPAAMALVASNTPRSKTGYALGVLSSATAAGNVLGPLVGGVLSDFIGFRDVFFIVSALLIFTGILIIILVEERNKVDETQVRYTIPQNWQYLLRHQKLITSSVLIMLAALGIAFVRPIFVLYVETIDIDTRYISTITGALYSIAGIFSTISAAWWGKKAERTGLRKNLLFASMITGLMYLLHAFVASAYLLIPVRMVLGFSYGALLPLLFTSISNKVEFERKGGILGVASSFQILGNMIGPITGGLSAAFLGLRFSFVLTGMIFFVMVFTIFQKFDD